MTSSNPRWMSPKRDGSERSALVAMQPYARQRLLEPETWITPQPVFLSPGSIPIMTFEVTCGPSSDRTYVQGTTFRQQWPSIGSLHGRKDLVGQGHGVIDILNVVQLLKLADQLQYSHRLGGIEYGFRHRLHHEFR